MEAARLALRLPPPRAHVRSEEEADVAHSPIPTDDVGAPKPVVKEGLPAERTYVASVHDSTAPSRFGVRQLRESCAASTHRRRKQGREHKTQNEIQRGIWEFRQGCPRRLDRAGALFVSEPYLPAFFISLNAILRFLWLILTRNRYECTLQR